MNGEMENRQTDREDGRKNDDLLHQLSGCVCVGGVGGGGGAALDRQA